METKLNLYQNNAKNSSVILTSESNEMDFSNKLPILKKNGNVLINARDLHRVLESKREFRHWIKDRIDRCDLIENKEYVVLEYNYEGNLLIDRADKKDRSDNQQVAKRDYALSLSAAKEVSMIENNSIGKAVRRYFIKMEENNQPPKTYSEALRKLADQVDENEKIREDLEKQKIITEHVSQERDIAIKDLESKKEDLEFAESFVEPGSNDMLVREVAKKLEQNSIIVAEKTLRIFLQKTKFFTKREDDGQYELYANIIKKGYAHYRSYFVDKYSGEKVHKQTIYITGLGYRAIAKAIKISRRDLFLELGGKFYEPCY